MRILTPDIYLEHINRVTPELLKRYGIKGLILDVDNTLTHHNSQEISAEVLAWIDLMRQNGIKLMIASNNNAPRIEPFSKKIGIDAIPNSAKPLPIGYQKAKKCFGFAANEIAVIGDQVYTDILGANACGMLSIMVRYFEAEESSFFRLKRKLEKPVLAHYRKIGQKGEKR